MGVDRYGYVYITTNLVTGMKYVGKHKAISFDEKYLGSGTLIKKAIKEYGIENFKVELIEWCFTEEQSNLRERYWIKLLDAVNSDNYYNLQVGGDYHYSQKGLRFSEEHKQNAIDSFSDGFLLQQKSETKLGDRNGCYGKTCITDGVLNKFVDDSELENLLEGWDVGMTKTNSPSEETRKKWSEQRKGDKNGCYGKVCINNGEICKYVLPSLLDEWLSKGWIKGALERTRKERSSRQKGEGNSCYGKVCINNGKENKFVLPSELDLYFSVGWVKGSCYKKSGSL